MLCLPVGYVGLWSYRRSDNAVVWSVFIHIQKHVLVLVYEVTVHRSCVNEIPDSSDMLSVYELLLMPLYIEALRCLHETLWFTQSLPPICVRAGVSVNSNTHDGPTELFLLRKAISSVKSPMVHLWWWYLVPSENRMEIKAVMWKSTAKMGIIII